MTEPVLHIELPDHGPPSERRAAIAVAVTWATAVLGVVLAVLTSDWLVAAYALVSAIGAMGWWLALARWRAWRELALGTLVLLDHATKPPEDGAP